MTDRARYYALLALEHALVGIGYLFLPVGWIVFGAAALLTGAAMWVHDCIYLPVLEAREKARND